MWTCVARSSTSLFFFNDTATTEIYTLSLHDALPIWPRLRPRRPPRGRHPPREGSGRAPGEGRCLREDRKSTRLNSSHSQISYAVFCLKKKKQSIMTPRPVIEVRRSIRYVSTSTG